jgi:hypothetical protein
VRLPRNEEPKNRSVATSGAGEGIRTVETDRSRSAAADNSVEDPNLAPDATGRDRTTDVASLATTPISGETQDVVGLATALAEAVLAGDRDRAVTLARAVRERGPGRPAPRGQVAPAVPLGTGASDLVIARAGSRRR